MKTRGGIALCSVLLTFALGAHAQDPLEATRQALRQLRGTSPIAATVERHLVREQKDRPTVNGAATARVVAGPDGLQATLPPAQLASAVAEKLSTDPDGPRPVSSALMTLDLADVAVQLSAAGALLRDLEGAAVTKVEPEDANGAGGKRIELDLAVRLPKADMANVKEAKSTATLVVGVDGVPLSMQKHTMLHGRIMLMSIDVTLNDSATYAVQGDRLVELTEQRVNDTNGLGQKAHEDRSTTIRVETAK
ncbi:MAG TPA: hypothetical protein VFB36_03580 [Nevskiaceae bacterium]|nr:hypothetical protein [Nevskiaceae bacterium]